MFISVYYLIYPIRHSGKFLNQSGFTLEISNASVSSNQSSPRTFRYRRLNGCLLRSFNKRTNESPDFFQLMWSITTPYQNLPLYLDLTNFIYNSFNLVPQYGQKLKSIVGITFQPSEIRTPSSSISR